MAVRWPSGVRSGAVACGIKGSGLDLALLTLPRGTRWAGVFTINAAAAAPVTWSRSLRDRAARALVVNSGNANACTGEQGQAAVHRTAESAGFELGLGRDEILVASTGPIGVALPVEQITDAMPRLVASRSNDPSGFAEAILTTDTTTKVSTRHVGGASFVGVAKGAAMVSPNMATMLAFIATDALIETGELRSLLAGSVDRTFNRISIDGCASTNDSVYAFATGDVTVPHEILAGGFEEVCSELAEAIVRDAEGGTRLLRIAVSGARDESHAMTLSRAVAGSALWRAAVHGADPNWGRIVSALGAADHELDLAALEVAIGSEVVFSRGRPTGSLKAAAAAMAGSEVLVTCEIGRGDGSAEMLCTDLSEEYVTLNAEVST